MTQLRPHFFGGDLIQAGIDCNARDPVLQWHFAGELRQFLEKLDENHLGKVLLGCSTGSMGTDNFRDEWVKTPNQFASRVVIMRERSLNQRACIRIIHVVQIASTLPTMTTPRASWLQVLGLGSARASRAVSGALAGNFPGVESPSDASCTFGEGAECCTRGACAPPMTKNGNQRRVCS